MKHSLRSIPRHPFNISKGVLQFTCCTRGSYFSQFFDNFWMVRSLSLKTKAADLLLSVKVWLFQRQVLQGETLLKLGHNLTCITRLSRQGLKYSTAQDNCLIVMD